MKHFISILLVFGFLSIPCVAKNPKAKHTPAKKSGMISKIKESATRGFGWGLGREAAKETVKGVKSVVKKGVENAKEMKDSRTSNK